MWKANMTNKVAKAQPPNKLKCKMKFQISESFYLTSIIPWLLKNDNIPSTFPNIFGDYTIFLY